MLTILMEDVHACEGWKTQTLAGAVHSAYLSLKAYFGCLFIVHIAQGAASSGIITLDKSPLISGVGASAGIMMNHWAKCEDTPLVADTFTAGAAATSITPSTTGTGSSIYLVDVKGAELGDGFPVVRLNMALSSASNIAACMAVLYGPRHAEAVDKLVSGIVD